MYLWSFQNLFCFVSVKKGTKLPAYANVKLIQISVHPREYPIGYLTLHAVIQVLHESCSHWNEIRYYLICHLWCSWILFHFVILTNCIRSSELGKIRNDDHADKLKHCNVSHHGYLWTAESGCFLASFILARKEPGLHSCFLGSFQLQWILTIPFNQGSKMLQNEVHLASFHCANSEIWQPWHAFFGTPEI